MENKRLKVLMLTDDFEPIYGGVSSVVKNSSIALSKFADVTIGSVIPPKSLRDKINDDPSYTVIRCNGKYNKLTTNMSANLHDKNFTDYIKSQNFDIIHCHFPLKLYKFALSLRKKYNIPVVITAHSIFYTDFKAVLKFNWLTNLAIHIVLKRYNKANKTFCVTKFAQNFLNQYGLKNSIVVNNAVNMKDFEPIDINYQTIIKQKYNILDTDFVLLSVCRLVPMKNLLQNITIFASLHKTHPQTKYLIVGDGSQKAELENHITKLQLNDCCFLLGAITNKKQLGAIYAMCNAISFLSKGDSCGLIQYESAYFKKPTISIKNTAVADSITDMRNGVVLNTENKSLLVSKKSDKILTQDFINKVGSLVDNKELCKNLGINAKQEIFREYDDNYAKELISLYEQIINEYKNKNQH